LWKRIFKSIKAIRRKEIKTNVGKTDGFSIPLRVNYGIMYFDVADLIYFLQYRVFLKSLLIRLFQLHETR